MADENNRKIKGFAGLSDLASDAGGQDSSSKPDHPEPKSAPESSELEHQSKPTQHSGPSPKPVSTSSTSSSTEEQEIPDEVKQAAGSSGGNNAGWWILGSIVFVLFMGWCTSSIDNNNTRSSSRNTSTTQNTYSSPTTGSTDSGSVDVEEARYVRPPVRANTILTLPQARWIHRESLRIETMRILVDTEDGIAEFNQIVDDFNKRLGQAYDDVWEQAERDVKTDEDEILLGAILDAANMGRLQMNKEAQNYLLGLGYNPGPIDGIYGPKTFSAVIAYEKDAGLTEDGWIDLELVSHMRKAASSNSPEDYISSRGSNASGLSSRQSTGSEIARRQTGTSSDHITSAPPTGTPYFTIGSHQNDVIRLQGTPDEVDVYEASGYEVWNYGFSEVNISNTSKRVLSWDDNSNNLKVRLLPGSNTTSSNYYTRGSHQDDVIRLQGTPDEIEIYEASGYELWSYGYSKVDISYATRRVLSWDNNGNNLKVKLVHGSNITSKTYYTLGSHQDDVIRLQGTPDEIEIYKASGYELWSYSYSNVKISYNSKKVLSWDNNSNNLKVKLVYGDNTTSNNYYTRGSHQDDVIRLQGTPDEIEIYDTSGYELWSYGYDSVKISISTKQVIEWENRSNNLKVR